MSHIIELLAFIAIVLCVSFGRPLVASGVCALGLFLLTR